MTAIRSLSRRATFLAIAATAMVSICVSAQAQERPLKVGVTAGVHAEIMEVVKTVGERSGLKIQIVEFSDYIQPNAALDQGDLDANSYQHQPFLEQQIKDRGYKLVSIGKTVVAPIGIYSKRVKSVAQIPDGGKLAIPNDPTNGGRVLALLEKLGLLRLKPGAGVKATVLDVVENRKKLKLTELDAAQLARSLEDVDAAAINTNYAMSAGLVPARDAIALEDAKSPYANLLVVRAKDKDKPALQRLVQIYHDPEVKAFIETKYGKSLIPAW
jgi:D-methionine transport system substrate-binding protein